VALGYTPAMAAEEAGRCIQCPKRPCVAGCPVNIDIPEFIKAVRDGKMAEAVTVLKKTNAYLVSAAAFARRNPNAKHNARY